MALSQSRLVALPEGEQREVRKSSKRERKIERECVCVRVCMSYCVAGPTVECELHGG
jgi:hypothetical protein